MATAAKHRGVYENPRGSGVWYILYYDADGKRHREKVGRRSLAIQAYIQRKSEIRANTFAPPGRKDRISFRELATLCLEHKKNHVSEFTYKNYVCHFAYWSEIFGSMSAAAIPVSRIATELNALRTKPGFGAEGKKPITNSTANLYRISLGAVFTFGIKTGRIHLPKNPIAAVRKFKENEWRIRYLLVDEEEALRQVVRDACPDREPELDLALNTGMRRGEIFNLSWDMIDRDLRVIQAIGKTGRRFLPLNDTATKAIERLRELSPAGSLYVIRERADRDTRKDWRKWFEFCVRTAKIVNFKFHDLRHTFASRLVMKGADLPTVQQLLGHKSILMTMRYAHLSPNHKKATVAKLDGSNPAPDKIVPIRKKA